MKLDFLGMAGVALLGVLACVGCGPARVAAPGADAEAAGRIRATLVSASAAAGSVEAAAATGTGWGGLKGRFTYAGAPPQSKALVVETELL